MNKSQIPTNAVTLAFMVGWSPIGASQIVVPGADGSDGVFTPAQHQTHTIDLDLAADGAWDSPSPVAGQGVFDIEKKVVVFKYESVDIRLNTFVTFANHSSGAPVVWLVSGDVRIAGSLILDAPNAPGNPGGPGGGAGGLASFNSTTDTGAGLGFGGGFRTGEAVGGSFATPGIFAEEADLIYGDSAILPLVGGSGGGGSALLIACAGEIRFEGQGAVRADGGKGNGGADGSGGAVRLVANRVSGTGLVTARGGVSWNRIRYGYGGDGRIRIECNECSSRIQTEPLSLPVPPTDPVKLWPDPGDPAVEVVSVHGVAAPPAPLGVIGLAAPDITIENESEVEVGVRTRNVDPAGAEVTIKVTPRRGPYILLKDEVELVSGDATEALWRAVTTFSAGYSAVQARVVGP